MKWQIVEWIGHCRMRANNRVRGRINGGFKHDIKCPFHLRWVIKQPQKIPNGLGHLHAIRLNGHRVKLFGGVAQIRKWVNRCRGFAPVSQLGNNAVANCLTRDSIDGLNVRDIPLGSTIWISPADAQEALGWDFTFISCGNRSISFSYRYYYRSHNK